MFGLVTAASFLVHHLYNFLREWECECYWKGEKLPTIRWNGQSVSMALSEVYFCELTRRWRGLSVNCRSVKSHSVNSLSVNSRSVRWDSVMCRRTDSLGVSRSNLIVEWQLLRHSRIYSACSVFIPNEQNELHVYPSNINVVKAVKFAAWKYRPNPKRMLGRWKGALSKRMVGRWKGALSKAEAWAVQVLVKYRP